MTSGAPHASPPLGPVRDRIDTLDILRGFAMLGIYLSIIHGYNGFLPRGGEGQPPLGAWDPLLLRLQSLFINKRFIGLFSLLFGLGIAIQQRNVLSRGQRFGPYFVRRMAVLGALGLVNTTFFFTSEILLVYAVFGLLTLALRRMRTAVLLAIALFAYLVWGQWFEYCCREDLIAWFGWLREQYPIERAQEIYRTGPLIEVIRLRWLEYAYVYTDNNFHLGMSLAMILSGYVIGREGRHERWLADLPRLRPLFAGCMLYTVGFATYALRVGQTDFIFMWDGVVYLFYAPFLLTSMFTYAYLLAAWRQRGPHPVLAAMSRNGRLSLTAYMGGAAAFALVFYAPGAGLYMRLRPPALAMIALLLYLALTVFSTLWLRRFDRGPMEWVLRRLSYGRPRGA